MQVVKQGVRIHPSAEVSDRASVGHGTVIWHHAQVREHASIGANCILGKGVYIDVGVKLGDNVKVQNYATIYHGAEVESGVFIGPHVCFTNDNLPRAINSDGSLKGAEDWGTGHILVRYGASLGANSTILPKVVVGEWAMVAAGAVVTHDVPAHGLVVGTPARLAGFVCRCGARLTADHSEGDLMVARCPVCGDYTHIPIPIWRQAP